MRLFSITGRYYITALGTKHGNIYLSDLEDE